MAAAHGEAGGQGLGLLVTHWEHWEHRDQPHPRLGKSHREGGGCWNGRESWKRSARGTRDGEGRHVPRAQQQGRIWGRRGPGCSRGRTWSRAGARATSPSTGGQEEGRETGQEGSRQRRKEARQRCKAVPGLVCRPCHRGSLCLAHRLRPLCRIVPGKGRSWASPRLQVAAPRGTGTPGLVASCRSRLCRGAGARLSAVPGRCCLTLCAQPAPFPTQPLCAARAGEMSGSGPGWGSPGGFFLGAFFFNFFYFFFFPRNDAANLANGPVLVPATAAPKLFQGCRGRGAQPRGSAERGCGGAVGPRGLRELPPARLSARQQRRGWSC